MGKKYIVALTAAERSELERLTKTGKTAAYKINHARILLKADSNQAEGEWTDTEISEALNISIATIERVGSPANMVISFAYLNNWSKAEII